jgi:hypothetical protein
MNGRRSQGSQGVHSAPKPGGSPPQAPGAAPQSPESEYAVQAAAAVQEFELSRCGQRAVCPSLVLTPSPDTVALVAPSPGRSS